MSALITFGVRVHGFLFCNCDQDRWTDSCEVFFLLHFLYACVCIPECVHIGMCMCSRVSARMCMYVMARGMPVILLYFSSPYLLLLHYLFIQFCWCVWKWHSAHGEGQRSTCGNQLCPSTMWISLRLGCKCLYLWLTLHCFWRQWLSLNLELTDWERQAGQQAPRIFLSLSSRRQDYRWTPLWWLFVWVPVVTVFVWVLKIQT